jgi:hypothetical protein
MIELMSMLHQTQRMHKYLYFLIQEMIQAHIVVKSDMLHLVMLY